MQAAPSGIGLKNVSTSATVEDHNVTRLEFPPLFLE